MTSSEKSILPRSGPFSQVLSHIIPKRHQKSDYEKQEKRISTNQLKQRQLQNKMKVHFIHKLKQNQILDQTKDIKLTERPQTPTKEKTHN